MGVAIVLFGLVGLAFLRKPEPPAKPVSRVADFATVWLLSAVASLLVYFAPHSSWGWGWGSLVIAGLLSLSIATAVARPSLDRARWIRAVIAAFVGFLTPVAVLIAFLLAVCPDGGCWS